MRNTKLIINSAIAGIIAMGALSAVPAMAAKGDNEKCAGISKAGKNDCGTSKSACAGTIKSDNDAEAWIAVPTGTCERIAGSHLVTASWAKHGGGSK